MSQSEEENHPLMNSVVLDSLIQYVWNDLPSLKKVLLVCKTWKDAAENARKSVAVPVTIVQDDRMPEEAVEGAIKLSEFLQQQRNKLPAKFPHGNFILHNWRVDKDHFSSVPGPDNNADLIKRFWAEFGKNIRVLILSGGDVDFITDKTVEEFFLSVLPNVERLTLKNCRLNVPLPDFEGRALAGQNLVLPPLNFYEVALANDRHIDWHAQWQLPYARRLEMVLGHQVADILRRRRPGPPHLVGAIEPQEGRVPIMQNQNVPGIEQFAHQKLKHISFENVDCCLVTLRSLISWKNFISAVPYLEIISIRDSPWIVAGFFSAIENDAALKKLRTVDIMNMNTPRLESRWSDLELSSDKLALQKLTVNCGVDTKWINGHNVLTTQARSLETLHLYRAPGLQPYPNLPCKFEMPKLTVLHLWGGISKNLNFLQFLPNLKVFKWDPTCHAEDNDGLPDCEKMRQPCPEFVKHIVESSNELGADFKLDSVTTLEIELGSMRMESWQKLGVWMPNVTALKGVVSNDDQFPLILNMWPNLYSLQLAHGSSVSANQIMDVIIARKSFPNLSTFIWKPCSCPRSTADNEYEECCAESEIRRLVSHTVVLPWRDFRMRERQGFPDFPLMES